MKHFLIGCLFLFPLFGDCPNSPTNITVGEMATLHDSINVITGDYYEGCVDAVVHCAEPFSIHRVHVASDPKKGLADWRFQDEKISVYMGKKGCDGAIWLTEASGTVIHFVPIDNAWGFSDIAPETWELKPCAEHFSNVAGGVLSGKHYVGNYKLTFSRKENTFTLTTGSGEKRIYQLKGFKHNWSRTDQGKNRSIKEEVFPLVKTIRPNGNRLLYTYDLYHRLNLIRSTDRTEKVIFGHAYFHYRDISNVYPYDITTSDGKKIAYQYEQVGGHQRLAKVDYNSLRSESYHYIQPGHVTLKSHGVDNVMANEYDNQGRLVAQRITLGPKGIPGFCIEESPLRIFAARALLSYPSDRETKVYDPFGHLTHYHYSRNQRLAKIDFYEASDPGSSYGITDLHNLPNQHTLDPAQSDNQILLGSECFGWTNSFLTSREKISKDRKNCERVTYEYDSWGSVRWGNVCQEEQIGCLRGYFSAEGDKACETPEPTSLPFCEDVYKKRFTYSRDGFNNLSSESYDQTYVNYKYLEGTDLLRYKEIRYKNQVCEEEYFVYDPNRCLIQHEKYEGDRTFIQVIQPRASHPGFGLPEVVKDYVLEGEDWKLQRREHLTYSPQNLVTCRKVYGSSGDFCYALFYEYDPLGRLIRQVNALGEEESYVYDTRGNRIEEHTPSTDTFITYDYRNQPTKVEKRDRRGTSLISYTEYDVAGNKKAQIDFSGNRIQSVFDRSGNPVATYLPPHINPSGEFEWTKLERHYDIFGNLLEECDDKGDKTRWEYNDRGQPIHISYPDGTEERFTYFLNGELRFHIDVTGLKTLYERDYKGRPLTVSLIDQDDNILKKTSYVYQGNLLSNIIHPDSTSTEFTYDAAGRLKEENHEGQISCYTYDLLGRVATKTLPEEEEAIVYAYSYDWLDRLIREEVQDGEGQILSWKGYEYDYEGNQTLVSDGGSVTRIEYGIAGPICRIDPLGEITTISYNYDCPIGGLKGLEKTETDPLGNASIMTYNPRGKPLFQTRKNAQGESLAHTLFLYDPVGSKLKERHTIFAEGKPSRHYFLEWTYDPLNRPLTLTEGGEGYQRTTSYTYHLGRLTKTVKPSGTEINRTYDLLGRLLTESSHDFLDTYVYDPMDRLLTILSQDGSLTYRTYNARGHLTAERLANGHALHYQPTLQGRLKTLTLPDGSHASYTYLGPYIASLRRRGKTFTYAYDERGQVIQVDGPISSSITRNLRGEVTGITAPSFSQDCTYDPVGNLQTLSTVNGPLKLVDPFAYNDLYQLTSEGDTPSRFQYDSIGNRLKVDETPCQVDPCNQLTRVGELAISYDEDGHPVQQGDVHFSYDSRGRLVQLETPTASYKYTYDPFHRRVSVVIASEQVDDLYTGNNHIGTCTSKGKTSCFRPMGPGLQESDIGSAPLIELSNRSYFPIYDHRGSVALLLDREGNSVEHYTYSAFGEEKIFNPEGNALSESAINNPYRFYSKPTMHGLVSFGRRYYQPQFGRWLTPDPKGFDEGPHLYLYCHNCPLTGFDLYGLSAWSTTCSVYLGINDGFTDAVLYFIPNVYHTLDATCNFIWDCGAHPVETTKRVGRSFSAANQQLLHGSMGDRVGVFFPRIGNMVNNWGNLSAEQIGYQLGHMGGEFAGSAVMAGGLGKLAAAAGPSLRVSTLSTAHVGLKPLSVQLAEQSSLSKSLAPKYPVGFPKQPQPRPLDLSRTGGKVWTSNAELSSVENAYRHWKIHGQEFSHLKNSKQYAEAAHSFLNDPPAQSWIRTRPNGEQVVYNVADNIYGVRSTEGLPKTMFKPDDFFGYKRIYKDR